MMNWNFSQISILLVDAKRLNLNLEYVNIAENMITLNHKRKKKRSKNNIKNV